MAQLPGRNSSLTPILIVVFSISCMMPEMDGLTLGKEIRNMRPDLPFIYLTAKSQKEDMIEGYKSGADDYLTKPFDSEVLVLKLQALLNRGTGVEKRTSFRIGKMLFDSELRTLTAGLEVKKLSPKENQLLLILVESSPKVVSREEIMTTIWDEDTYFKRRSMDDYMAKLRKYLALDESIRITSLHAGGYQLVY